MKVQGLRFVIYHMKPIGYRCVQLSHSMHGRCVYILLWLNINPHLTRNQVKSYIEPQVQLVINPRMRKRPADMLYQATSPQPNIQTVYLKPLKNIYAR